MNYQQLQTIFSAYQLWEITAFERIPIWFTNQVYTINDRYILKAAKSDTHSLALEKEVYCYELFKGILPVPQILVFDKSNTYFSQPFMIYRKIPGQNLYSVWHLLKNEQRKLIIQQLCKLLKTINSVPYFEFIEQFPSPYALNWELKISSSIKNSLFSL